MDLNARASTLVEAFLACAEERRVRAVPIEKGGRFIDCGIQAPGGLLAGLELARICMSGLAEVTIVPGEVGGRPCPHVQVVTDHPVFACLASQYAGWAIDEPGFFAMGSGPMRLAAAREPIFKDLHLGPEDASCVVGVLEGRKPPTHAVIASIATACGVPPSCVTLLAAPTASLAGGVQIVARAIETALHKLHTLHFDISRIISAHGVVPLPPVAKHDLAAIGRTNDAILYGARVVLYVVGDDASLIEVGSKVPSCSSTDHGEPFSAIFARYNNDFYKVDPHLFSPAEVAFHNLETGLVHSFGRVESDVLVRSFYPS
ncbi:methenyltetrahydromethanopterin cyclohydrolase [Isosphaeraceae bacterium EP7]